MEKVDYDMASHASESSDFLNVLLAQVGRVDRRLLGRSLRAC
jgi:hypothetical protein